MRPFVGFIGPSYQLRSVSVDAQKTLNLYLEINELGTGKNREIAALISTPGLTRIATLAGPGRGLYTAGNGRLFAVSGNKFYEITLTAALEFGTLNTSTGIVCMSDNGFDLLLVDGLNGYVFTFATNTFAQITDPDFPVASACAFVDQYLIVNVVGTRKFQISALVGATDWNALDFATKEGATDELLTLIVDHRELWLLGRTSTEVYFNSGALDFPFERQGFLEQGIAAANTLQKLDNSIFCVSRDVNGQNIVNRALGFQWKRVSTHAVERAIAGYGDISTATSYTYQEKGHAFYVVNFPNANTTWALDVSTGLWHERDYTKADGVHTRHRAQNHAFAGGRHIVDDFENGILYQFDDSTHTDDGAPITRQRRSPHLSNNGARFAMHAFQLDMETGVGLASGQGSDPQVMLRISRDGGHSWGNEHWKSAGKQGKFKHRALWRRLGTGRDFVFEVTITDPISVALISALLDAEGLRN
jgi:hypothetical protein